MISVDWKTRIITVPRSEMILVSSSPEIRQFELYDFRKQLKALEDNAIGISYVDTHRHSAPVSVGGVVLARVIELINNYRVVFENGDYRVNAVGANSNVADVLIRNQVQLVTANSVGLADVGGEGLSGGALSEDDRALLMQVSQNQRRLLKVYGMIPDAVFKMPPPQGGPVLEDGLPIADVTGDCEKGFTITGRPGE